MNKELSYARNKLNIHINSKQKQNVKTKQNVNLKQKQKQKTINPKPDQTGLLSPYLRILRKER